MSGNRYPLIAREGWLSLALGVAVALGVAHFAGSVWSVPVWLATLLVLLLFRDPEREIPSNPLAVVSPCDGVVESIATTHDDYLDREALKISIVMSHLGVYSTRSPVEGKIMNMVQAEVDGEALPHGVWLQTVEGDDLVVAMYRGPLQNAPRCYVRYGDRVGQGQRCGFIHLGSRVDVYLPVNSRVAVREGDKVRGATDVIATLVHK